MKKILSRQQLREADKYTIEHRPIASIDLMERAAGECSRWLLDHFGPRTYTVMVGPGNNGGDGSAIARQLTEAGGNVCVIRALERDIEPSEDHKINLGRLKHMELEVTLYTSSTAIDPSCVVVDALFGTGLTREIEGIYADAVKLMNAHPGPVVAIDTPSGLMAENNDENDLEAIVQADHTLTFQCPMLSFLMQDLLEYVGEIAVLDIGLDKEFIHSLPCERYLLESRDISSLLRPRRKASHKGNYGHGFLVAGTQGMAGAAVLATRSCLRSGAGLVSCHVPAGNRTILQSSAPEAMCLLDEHEHLHTNWRVPQRCTAIGIGPGIGTDQRTANLLKRHIQEATVPLVLDADALNILAEYQTWLSFLPQGTILTPHPAEFDRLTGAHKSCYERYQKALEFAIRYSVFVILKGVHTTVLTPTGRSFFNSSGNAGMAKGGSGDVLTGLLVGLLAQGYSSTEACLIGVFTHGLAGDLAADEIGQDGMTAYDLLAQLPYAWKELRRGEEDR